LKSIGFHRGFYCSADALEMFLTQGSPDLAKALVEGLHAIFIARGGNAHWALYANPALAPTPPALRNRPPKAPAIAIARPTWPMRPR
jgi:hypothetical protein